MASAWNGLAEQIRSRRYLKLLLVLPFLVLLSVGSYKIGRSRQAAGNAQNVDVVADNRFRRDVSQTPISSSSSSSQTVINTGGGATYIRWGRTDCPSESEPVYPGIAGGSWYDNTGGGANYLCLPSDPLWGSYNESVEKGAKLYGSEYQDPSAINLKNFGGQSAHDHNVPCVVCRSQTKSSVVMVPARNRCHDDWRAVEAGVQRVPHGR